MEASIICQVSLGQFSGEFAVSVETFDGSRVSLFVSEDDVEITQNPTNDSPVEGFLKVEIIDESEGLLLLRLPQPTLENGQNITVRAEGVRQEA